MSVVKSFAVGNGDMYYITHASDNFTIIDCCMSPEDRDEIMAEIKEQSKPKGIVRFISTHPDEDHLLGLVELDDEMGLLNFYCVANEAMKPEPSKDFERYCALRDHPKKAFHIRQGCSRRWMNDDDGTHGSSGINILWPDPTNVDFKAALQAAKEGKSPNNTSCIIKYSVKGGVAMVWMGDLETDFMNKIVDQVDMPEVDILFAPHHGRDSGKVPIEWLSRMDPKIVVLGECPSSELNYYKGYNTLTQNSAGEITFWCTGSKVHIYVSNDKYTAPFLDQEGRSDTYGKYIGTLAV